jgi:peptidoglycan/xylan/chitin deacetylase (PgdA/CDA1 family)
MDYKKPGLFERIERKVERVVARATARTPLTLPSGFRAVSFCFDDFPAITVTTAAPLLEASGARGSFYTCFGILGEPSDSGKLTDTATIADLHARGHEIGCHTYDHILCTGNNAHRIADTCARNRAAATPFGITLQTFAYPEGEMCLRAKKTIQSAYIGARTVRRGINKTGADLYALNAAPLYECADDVPRAELADLVENGGWLIFITHDVQDTPSQYGTSTRLFTELLETCTRARIPVRPVGDVLKSLRK